MAETNPLGAGDPFPAMIEPASPPSDTEFFPAPESRDELYSPPARKSGARDHAAAAVAADGPGEEGQKEGVGKSERRRSGMSDKKERPKSGMLGRKQRRKSSMLSQEEHSPPLPLAADHEDSPGSASASTSQEPSPHFLTNRDVLPRSTSPIHAKATSAASPFPKFNEVSHPALANQTGRSASPPPPGLPPVLSPPYWQVSPHKRTTSVASVASTINSRPAPIRLEDNTPFYETNGALSPEGKANGHAHGGGRPNGVVGPGKGAGSNRLMSPSVRSPLWARVVRIPSHTLVAGTVRGVGDYVVWTCCVDTLDGGTIVLRKRYSEFVTLREELAATFPRSVGSLPTLPPKSLLKKFQEGFLERRRAGLEFFLK